MRAVSLAFVLAALIAADPQTARANLVCRTELADGRVLFSPPVMGQDGIFCRGRHAFDRHHDAFADRHEFATPSLPSMNVTTPTGPFTTGEIGPFTTFSNSPPHEMRHR